MYTDIYIIKTFLKFMQLWNHKSLEIKIDYQIIIS
jgi:hypothetical protein